MGKKNHTERTYHYRIDKEGHLWIEDTELTDLITLKFFMHRLEKLPNGDYRVMCLGEENLIEVEDVPYVVQSIQVDPDKVQLIFPGGYQEILDPNTLRVGKDNILYCKVRTGEFEARFNRRPYLEITKLVERDPDHTYHLKLGADRYIIHGVIE